MSIRDGDRLPHRRILTGSEDIMSYTIHEVFICDDKSILFRDD